jgi:hypothetical protein
MIELICDWKRKQSEEWGWDLDWIDRDVQACVKEKKS